MSEISQDIADAIVAKTQTGRYLCPRCSAQRKKRNPTLVVTVFDDHVLFDCHHCGLEGRVNKEDPLKKYTERKAHERKKITPIPTKLNHDASVITGLFENRGIGLHPDDLAALKPLLTTGNKYYSSAADERMSVGFVYGDKSDPQAIKWRPADNSKHFTQDGAAASFFGTNLLPRNKDGFVEELIIVEGEADVIALASMGIHAVSVPNGGQLKVSKFKKIDPSEEGKFAYVWEDRDLHEKASKVILAVDNDQAGEGLAEELARRIGRAKCWRTKFPDGCKDPTDVIVKLGTEAMLDLLNKSEPMPLQGIYSANDYVGIFNEIYIDGIGGGESTGIPSVDNLFTVKRGHLYTVTGYPGSGKSTFVDQLMVNLSLKNSWKWAVASFENPPPIHLSLLSEKIIGKPFYSGLTPRMNKTEMRDALAFMNDHYVFFENRDGSLATVHSIMDRTKQAVMRLGVGGLVIDPYNYIAMDAALGEHQSITNMLTELSLFAKAYDVAIFFVAHPAKAKANQSGEFPVPTGHHISGSAAWWAKTDIGITLHRSKDSVGTEVHCWKVRYRWLGNIGETVIGYDAPTGRFFERNQSDCRRLNNTDNKLPDNEAASEPQLTSSNKHWQDDDWDKDDDGWGDL